MLHVNLLRWRNLIRIFFFAGIYLSERFICLYLRDETTVTQYPEFEISIMGIAQYPEIANQSNCALLFQIIPGKKCYLVYFWSVHV